MKIKQSTRRQDKKTVLRITVMSVFLAMALIIGVVERSIPFNIAVPGVKLGLSNVVILTLLYLYTPYEVFIVVMLKCFMLAMFSGSFSSLLYSLSGAVLSFFVMYGAIRLLKNKFSPTGVSILGAISHNIGQIIAASFVLSTVKLMYALPVLLISGAITGFIVGITVTKFLLHFKKIYIV